MTALSRRTNETFQYVEEHDNPFLALFPHRGDYLYAEHPDPGESPQWKTESRYFLSDRLIQQGSCLYGVRFGKTTNYLLLDVDTGSTYHPHRDRLATSRMAEVLEPIGLVSYVAVSSSYRGGRNCGVHLYFPLDEPQSSWTIALVVQTLLENAGFKLKPGQLEVFPNPKPYGKDSPTLYNGHRLPLQAGSYLLDADFQPIYTTQAHFVQQWKFAQGRNDLDSRRLKQVLKQAKRQPYMVTGKAQKFFNDLNAEIEPGWTGAGQTNRILGKLACRERVFYHVHHGGSPLEGEALAQVIVQIARSLPGYEEHCNHKAEIEERAREYARSAAKRYYPYGYRRKALSAAEKEQIPLGQGNVLSWNQQQSQAAQERIKKAVAELQQQGNLPSQKTARRNALRAYCISNKTLDKYPELWWEGLKSLQEEEYYPVIADVSDREGLKSLQEEEYYPIDANKLVGLAGCAAAQQQAQDSPASDVSEVLTDISSNASVTSDQMELFISPVGQQIAQLKLLQERRAFELRQKQMQQWLESDDPIFVAEAHQYFRSSTISIDSQVP